MSDREARVRWPIVIAVAVAIAVTAACAAPSTEIAVAGEVSQLAASSRHACAVTRSGSVTCWGMNRWGQLGDGTTESAPAGEPVAVVGVASVRQVSLGGDFSCAVLAAGSAACWGFNKDGQLGDGTSNSISVVPTQVSQLSGVQSIAAGRNHACAVVDRGDVMCWGGNEGGQLGDGTSRQRLVPVSVLGIDDAVALAAGDAFTCALRRSQQVSCWGMGGLGQLGDGTNRDRSVPAPVPRLSGVRALAARSATACVVLADGTARCWGANDSGQLGVGAPLDSSRPVRVHGVSDAVGVVVGDRSICSIDTAARTTCWGDPGRARPGPGPLVFRPADTRVSETPLALGDMTLCALSAADAVACAPVPAD